jgi:hypothetical protein
MDSKDFESSGRVADHVADRILRESTVSPADAMVIGLGQSEFIVDPHEAEIDDEEDGGETLTEDEVIEDEAGGFEYESKDAELFPGIESAEHEAELLAAIMEPLHNPLMEYSSNSAPILSISRAEHYRGFNLRDLTGAIHRAKHGENTMKLLELYYFCIKDHTTRERYQNLVKLFVFRQEANTYVPSCKKVLSGIVRTVLKNFVEFDCFASIGETKVPFQSISQILSNALNDDIQKGSIKSHVRKHMKRFLKGRDISKEGVLQELLSEQTRAMESTDGNDYVYDAVGSGSGYIENLMDTRDLWLQNYKEATVANMEILIVSLAFYDDGFSLNFGSKVQSTLFLLQILESPLMASQLCSLNLQMCMLGNTHVKDAVGINPYLQVFTTELKQLARGKVFTTYDAKGRPSDTMVFAFVLQIHGDIPASKELLGFSPSSVVSLPCVFCYSRYAEFNTTSAESRPKRGNVNVKWTSTELPYLGMDCISEVFKSWPGWKSPWRLCPDIMHVFNESGTDQKFFILVFDTFTENKSIAEKDAIYLQMSNLFAQYCKFNKLDNYKKFKNERQFLQMNAWGTKHFMLVSPLIMKVLKVELNLLDHRGSYNAWCRYVKAVKVLQQHSITKVELEELAENIPHILQYWMDNFGDKIIKVAQVLKSGATSERMKKVNGFITLKAHYFYHFVELIRLHGPPRLWSNYTKEAMIQRVKKLYRNTNASNREGAVFDAYRIMLHKEVWDTAVGESSGNTFRQWKGGCGYEVEGLTDFSSYKKVTFMERSLSNEGKSTRYETSVTDGKLFDKSFQVIRADKKPNIGYFTFKYFQVKAGDLIEVMEIPGFVDSKHHGFFKCLVDMVVPGDVKYTDDSTQYLMYELPLKDKEVFYEDYPHSRYTKISVKTTDLVIAPVNRFVKKVDAFPWKKETLLLF